MKDLWYFMGLCVALYIVDMRFGIIGCLIVIAALVLIERSTSRISS